MVISQGLSARLIPGGYYNKKNSANMKQSHLLHTFSKEIFHREVQETHTEKYLEYAGFLGQYEAKHGIEILGCGISVDVHIAIAIQPRACYEGQDRFLASRCVLDTKEATTL